MDTHSCSHPVSYASWLQRRSVALTALLVTLAFGAAAVASNEPADRLWVLLVLAPLLEEAVFRAGLQEAMLQRVALAPAANFTSALAVAIAHALARADPAALIIVLPALAIGYVYSRTRQLRWCVLLHSAMNGLWLLAPYARSSM